MEQEQNNNKNEFKDRVLFWIKENKLKIIFSFVFLLTILIILIAKKETILF